MKAARQQTTLALTIPPAAPPPEVVNDLLQELGNSLHAPILSWGAWGSSIPDRLKEEIILQRMLRLMKCKKERNRELLDLATDAEACAYLFTACLEFPFDEDWAQIYFYVAAKAMPKTKFPPDLTVTELTRNQLDDLNHLKRWIVNTQRKHMAQARKVSRKEKHDQVAEGGNHNRPDLPVVGDTGYTGRFNF
jgi:hypothetical protein